MHHARKIRLWSIMTAKPKGGARFMPKTSSASNDRREATHTGGTERMGNALPNVPGGLIVRSHSRMPGGNGIPDSLCGTARTMCGGRIELNEELIK